MANIFKNFSAPAEVEQDRLSGYTTYESDIYPAKIKVAYTGTTSTGSVFVTFNFDLGLNKEYRETFYISDKEGRNYYVDKSSGKQTTMPTFTLVNNICLLATGEPLTNLDMEDKTLNIYNREEQKELPTVVPVFTDLCGKEILLGILQVLDYKKTKNESSGQYEPTSEEITTNKIDAVFHSESKQTVFEASQDAPAAFWERWSQKNKGVPLNMRPTTLKKAAAVKTVARPSPFAAKTAAKSPVSPKTPALVFGTKK